jgi:voltage-dependent calcium channel N type alpha-1B
MDKADEELKETIKKLWPLQSIKKLDLLVPPREQLHGTPKKRKLTVGKIYAGLLVLENYRSYKQSLARYGEARPVSGFIYI